VGTFILYFSGVDIQYIIYSIQCSQYAVYNIQYTVPIVVNIGFNLLMPL